MPNTHVVFGRTTTTTIVVVFAAMLSCGNLVVVVNAFQGCATNANTNTPGPVFQPRSSTLSAASLSSTALRMNIPSSLLVSRDMNIGITRTFTTRVSTKRSRRDREHQRRGRLFGTSSPADELPPITNNTNGVDVDQEQNSSSPSSSSFFPPPDAKNSNNEELLSTTEAANTNNNNKNRGKKRRKIEKMRQKYFSNQIESRLARIVLYPVRVLIWKPFWMVMETFIDRLGEDGTVVVDSSSSTSTSTDASDITTTAAAATATSELNPDPASIEVVQEEEDNIVSDDTSSSTTTALDAEIQKEYADDASPPQSTSIAMEKEKDVVVEENHIASDDKTTATTPKGDRWCVSAPDVDLSGKWELIITKDFKKKYDKYLERLGQPRLVRSVALSGPVISQTMEELFQIDNGRSLLIHGKNIRGTWDRTLVASGSSCSEEDFEPLKVPIMTVDQEQVEAEAWWEEEGRVHVSWLRGVTMYGGGSFVSRRYYEEKEKESDQEVYVCESAFEFNDAKKEANKLAWRFRRQAE